MLILIKYVVSAILTVIRQDSEYASGKFSVK